MRGARISRLSEASLRTALSLDLVTILKEVVDNARLLINARYCALAVFDGTRDLQQFVTSGITPEERQRIKEEGPGGRGLLGYVNRSQKPLRLANLREHPESVGFPENHPPMNTFLGIPIRHLGKNFGNLYLTEKDGGQEFTPEDEEILVLFASHAAAVIANARRYSCEHRARADLEALISTSPVGVLVVDAETRTVLSVNYEGERIMGVLPEPGITLDQYREAMTCSRPSGNPVATDELPLERVLDKGATVRAEQLVFHHADGETVTALVNATPIYSQDGQILSAVAVIQDITPLGELEKVRSELLSKASHELRLPLSAIKGSTAMALDAPSPPDPEEARQLFQIIDGQADLLRGLINDLLDMTHLETGALSLTPEPADLNDLVDHARSTFLGGGAGNSIEFDLPPNLPRIQAGKLRILQVLDKLFANASRYSPDTSTIRVTARASDFHVAISVADESRGVSAEHLQNLFTKFYRRDREDGEEDAGNSGLDLAICKGIVEAHGGRIWAESDVPKGGTRITFTIPVAEEGGGQSALSYQGESGTEWSRIEAVDDPQYPQAVTPSPFRLGDLTIDYDERSVTLAGHAVQLSPTEYRLLLELSIKAGRVLTHRQLGERVWGSDHSTNPQVIRAYIKDIRQKLGDDARNPTFVFTVNRVGYRMAKPPGPHSATAAVSKQAGQRRKPEAPGGGSPS